MRKRFSVYLLATLIALQTVLTPIVSIADSETTEISGILTISESADSSADLAVSEPTEDSADLAMTTESDPVSETNPEEIIMGDEITEDDTPEDAAWEAESPEEILPDALDLPSDPASTGIPDTKESLTLDSESEELEIVECEIVDSDENTPSAFSSEYAYTVTPLLEPFNRFFYVQTENPDPTSFRFIDKQSIYYTEEDPCDYLESKSYRFMDVVYENKDTGRVHGGYIFQSKTERTDGGSLELQINVDGLYVDSKIEVDCAPVKYYVQYLIDTYADPSAGLFENLDSIQSALRNLALYPKLTEDVNKETNFPYPMLATHIVYPEIDLEFVINKYESCKDPLLLNSLYPFILSSLTFPGTIKAAALLMEPSCEHSATDVHYMQDITFNGETHTYGGAGTGSSNPLYNTHVEKLFSFDGSASDYTQSCTLEKLKAKRMEYDRYADIDASTYRSMIISKKFCEAVGAGSWIRTGTYTHLGLQDYKSYVYIILYADKFSIPSCVRNAWVDGRYVDENCQFVESATFADFPEADIIITDPTYSDGSGNHIFYYNKNTGCWHGGTDVLTPEDVAEMQVDRNRDKIPAGLVYDGTKAPGTPYSPCVEHNIETKLFSEPSCNSTGWLLRYCTECNWAEDVKIPTTPHTWSEYYYPVKVATCTAEGLEKRKCTRCGQYEEPGRIIPMKEHYFLTEWSQCLFCGYIRENTDPDDDNDDPDYDPDYDSDYDPDYGSDYDPDYDPNYDPESAPPFDSFALSVKAPSTLTYTGKALKPKVHVYIDGFELKPQYYSVSYSNNTRPGTASVTVKGKSYFRLLSPARTTFTIEMKGTSLRNVKASSKKKATVKWKKGKKNKGYQIQYATNKNFKKAKTKTVKKASQTSLTITGLKSGRKYYFRIRTYQKFGRKKCYSAWSPARKVKIK